MGDVLDTLFSILPVAIGIIWILKRFGRRAGSGEQQKKTSAVNSVEETPSVGVRSKRLRDEREAQEAAAARKRERQTKLEQVLARVSEYTRGTGETQSTTDSPWPGSQVQEPPPAPETSIDHSVLVDLDAAEESKPVSVIADDSSSPGPLERISRLPPAAQGIIWSELLGKPLALRRREEDT